MTDNNNKKGNVLVTYRFPNNADEITDIDNELIIQQQITKLMQKFISEGIISHFVVADDDVIFSLTTNILNVTMKSEKGATYSNRFTSKTIF